MPYFPRLTAGRNESTVADAGIGGAAIYYKPLANPGAANTKGAWTELLAATAFDSQWILFHFQTAGNAFQMMDLAIGPAGSEIIVIPNLVVTRSQAFGSNAPSSITIPLAIRKGTRIAARFQHQSGGTALFRIRAQVIAGGFDGILVPQIWEGWGQNTANTRGQEPVSGAVHTMGSYAQLIAATAFDTRWVLIAWQGVLSARHYAFELAIGAPGSERVILPDMQTTSEQNGDLLGPIPLAIPKGSRVAMRCASQTAGSTLVLSAWGGGRG